MGLLYRQTVSIDNMHAGRYIGGISVTKLQPNLLGKRVIPTFQYTKRAITIYVITWIHIDGPT